MVIEGIFKNGKKEMYIYNRTNSSYMSKSFAKTLNICFEIVKDKGEGVLIRLPNIILIFLNILHMVKLKIYYEDKLQKWRISV